MPADLQRCGRLLVALGLRHHVDEEEMVIRLVFVTRSYLNHRGEPFLVLTIETPDGGERVRAHARCGIGPGEDIPGLCLLACRLAADAPLVGIEFDQQEDCLRLVAEMPVVDGRLTGGQLHALIDGVVEAAEQWQIVKERHPSRRADARQGRKAS